MSEKQIDSCECMEGYAYLYKDKFMGLDIFGVMKRSGWDGSMLEKPLLTFDEQEARAKFELARVRE